MPANEPPEEDIWDLNSFYQLRGEVRCASGEYQTGLADLMRSLRSQSRDWWTQSSVACKVASGRRPLRARAEQTKGGA